MQKIVPHLWFDTQVLEAAELYVSLFEDSKINYGELGIFDLELVMMDHGYGGDATFNEAISFIIQCEDQKEIDYYWEKLSFVPEAEACGWVKDLFGLSWQVIPKMMEELLLNGTKKNLKELLKHS
ncbi:VOC family protein [Clostridium estertheticum]|uniref:VOC family protein n=1 Tax=Clostridium estertheticum TaxID=238834 RepID=UPI00217EF122|nr:VOC family protein [Clostridium estertheticum]